MLSREALLKHYDSFLSSNPDHNEEQCPLCGYEWTDEDHINQDRLDEQIALHTQQLRELLNESEEKFIESFKTFTNNQFQSVVLTLKTYLSQHPVDRNFVRGMADMDDLAISDLENKFKIMGIDTSAFFRKEPTMDQAVDVDGLINYLSGLKKEYSAENVTKGMRNAFAEFFLDRNELFMEIQPEAIEKKIKYIDYLYNLYQSDAVIALEGKIASKKKQISNAAELDKKLKELLAIYKASLDKYSKDLIRDIEVLFHIYSGRIMQDYQGGLGLFISNNNGIRFLTDPSRSFDAMFTMSSGQIAALIISFTLALNKKYSAGNKILFIDDPVQTMDELNIAGLVELLRNDFADRQIFISTHEDKMSTYMRYKFEKFGLKTKRFNMKLYHQERNRS